MNYWIDINMSMTPEEVSWWREFEIELAKQVKPTVPMPQVKSLVQPPKFPTQIVLKRGGTKYYTLQDDYQFPVGGDYPNAQGWDYV